MTTMRAREQHGRGRVVKRSLSAGIIAFAMLASGCSSQTASREDPSETADAGEPSQAATPAAASDRMLRVGVDGLPKLLVPSGSTAYIENSIVEQVYDGLVRADQETYEAAPSLATSWTISDDGLRYEFELRSDVVFHDGTPFDAEAVRLNFERLTDPDSPYYWEVGANVAQGSVYGNVDRLEVAGPQSVVFHLNEPDPDWLMTLTETFGHFVSPTVIMEHEPDEVTQFPIGTGPFQVDTRNASAITFTRNPSYWDGEVPLAGFVIRAFQSPASLVAALEAAEVDFITSAPLASLEARDTDRFVPVSVLGPRVVWIIRLNVRHEALSDRRVRQALNYAVDKEAIAEGLFAGIAEASTQPFPPSHVGYDPDQEGYPYDPDRAKELLAEAGYADGLSLTAIIPTGDLQQVGPLSQAVQEDLRQVGVDLQYETLEWTSYLEKIAPGLGDEYAIAVTEWADARLAWLREQLGTDGIPPNGSNLSYYSNPDADELMAQADAAGADPEERVRLYQEAQSLMVEDAAWLFMINYPFSGMSTRNVEGIGHATSGFDLSTASLNGDG